ncbi:MAG: pyrroloquinoline-quinone synthase PqqC [Proteobacteria bacterium]|nr:pyrroloquinoline-quinone synthase PqqC [Pseudomonadota bacterium]
MDNKLWTKEEFKTQLMNLQYRYHIHHPFQKAMNEGKLNQSQIKGWVANRFYYQITIPKKDAAILANCDDRLFRQQWIQRIIDHDGTNKEDGGIQAWLRLATACGLSRDETLSLKHVLPGVKFAVDAYYQFAKQAPWQEAAGSCLTELFAPQIHQDRLKSWPIHYPWIDQEGLTYFKSRIKQANQDVEHALAFTLDYCDTKEKQLRAINILHFKLDILWSILDTISIYHGFALQPKVKIAPRFKFQWEETQKSFVLLYPEGMIQLNESSSEILKLCDGSKSQDDIISILEKKFDNAEIKQDIIEFLEQAHAKGWITQQ